MTGTKRDIDDGNFTQLHNDILEALAQAPLNGSEFRCVMVVFRKTYGWGKKEDRLSYSQIADLTGLDRRAVIRAMQSLLDKKIIYRKDNGSYTQATWGFNKYFEMWGSDKNVTSDKSDTKTSDKNVTKTSDKSVTHKRKETKERNHRGAAPHLPLRDRTQKPREQIDYANDAGLTPKQLTSCTNTLLDITGLAALANAGHDKKLRDAQDAAVLLARLGYGDKDMILELRDRWLSQNEWRSNKTPSLNNLMEFASVDQQQQTQAIVGTGIVDFALEELP